MTIHSPKLKLVLLHVGLWLVYIAYESSLLLYVNPVSFSFWDTALNFSLYALLFYLNGSILLPWLYRTRHYLRFCLLLTVAFAAFCLARYGINTHLLPMLGAGMLRPVSSLKLFWAQTVSRGIYFLMLSFAYWFARNAVQLEQQKRRQEERLRLAEKGLFEAELVSLKSQINPHFLFNALNLFYSQVYPLSESTAKGILLLSDIMHYALKDTEPNGKVMLEDEIHHLQNYVALNQLRYNHRLCVQLEVTGSSQFLMMLPLVLITFVENCFKHGELFDAQAPLQIQLTLRENHLHLRTHNKKRQGPKEKSTGIGLANTRKRLEAAYPDRHTLQIDNSPEYYTCNLTLDL